MVPPPHTDLRSEWAGVGQIKPVANRTRAAGLREHFPGNPDSKLKDREGIAGGENGGNGGTDGGGGDSGGGGGEGGDGGGGGAGGAGGGGSVGGLDGITERNSSTKASLAAQADGSTDPSLMSIGQYSVIKGSSVIIVPSAPPCARPPVESAVSLCMKAAWQVVTDEQFANPSKALRTVSSWLLLTLLSLI
eukprot:5452563-Prymnesium_polylepis.1